MAYKAVLFDAYGTLLDVDSAASQLATSGRFDSLASQWPELSSLWRNRQLSYSWLRSVSGHPVPFWQITCDALDYSLEVFGLDREPGLRDALLDLYRTLQAYPEAGSVLEMLKAAGVKTAVLSNGNHQMLEDAFSAAGLRQQIGALLSAEDADIFKPSPAVYQLGCDAFDASPDELLFVSANGWDIAGASQFGFATFWVNRAGLPTERLDGRPDRIGRTLDDVPHLVAPT